MTLVLMLPGQGSQFASMGSFLYGSDAVFRRAFDDFLDAFGDGSDTLLRIWREGTRHELSQGVYAQPLLFAVTYAAGRAVLARNHATPTVLIGHSVGELAAATLAGIFDISLAGELLRARADLLKNCPPGGMVGCRADPGSVERCLRSAGVAGVIGAENAIDQCVVSVGEADLPQVIVLLRQEGVACMRVASTEPFHSPLMDGAARLLGEFLTLRADRLTGPSRPLMSAYSADWVGSVQARDPLFWTRQMAEPVRFRAALSRLDAPDRLFLEVGPGMTLTAAAGALGHVRDGTSRVLPTIQNRDGGHVSWQAAAQAASRHEMVT